MNMRWYLCPECGQKLFQIEEGAVIIGMHFKCKKCKKIIKVNVSR